jgi:hypothetical protein
MKVLRQFLRRSQLGLRKAFPTRAPTRFYSEGQSGGKRPLLDRTSGTYLGVTAGLLLGGFYVSQFVLSSISSLC